VVDLAVEDIYLAGAAESLEAFRNRAPSIMCASVFL
jgi:hypothetical protein